MLRRAVLVLLLYVGAEAQDVAPPGTKPAKNAKLFNTYYQSLNAKPNTSYRAIPPYYNPLNVCFNPYYYGFLNTGGLSQICPIPQPNIYYNLPIARPTSSQESSRCPTSSLQPGYIPWTWNTYPYTGQPLPHIPSLPKTTQTHGINFNSSIGKSQNAPENRTTSDITTKPPIKITEPNITVKIIPPVYNENATMVTNAFNKSNPETVVEPDNKKMNESTRSMIKHLLQIGSKLNKSSGDARHSGRGDINADYENELVIRPARGQPTNVYPLPKTAYGDTNEPSSIYDKWKIFTEFTPV